MVVQLFHPESKVVIGLEGLVTFPGRVHLLHEELRPCDFGSRQVGVGALIRFLPAAKQSFLHYVELLLKANLAKLAANNLNNLGDALNCSSQKVFLPQLHLGERRSLAVEDNSQIPCS